MPSRYYLELINAFPPRPIDNERSYASTQTQINKILDKSELNSDDFTPN